MPVPAIIPRHRTPPAVGAEAPDLTGFAAALERKRVQLGSDVTFLQPAIVTFPPNTPLDADGNPRDPMTSAATSAQTSAAIRCGVFFKAVNRGGAAGADVDSAIGFDEHTRIFAIAPYSSGAFIEDCDEMIVHGTRFLITAVKPDEIVQGVKRVLVYGAAEGNQEAVT